MGLALLDSAYWSRLWHQRLIRMLLLSLFLHAAVVVLVQPRSYPASPYTDVVIEARLLPDRSMAPPPPPSAVPSEPPPSSSPESTPTPQAVVPKTPTPVPEPRPAEPAVVPTPPAARSAPEVSAVLPSVPVMVDNTWYEARQLDVQPQAAEPINPIYPPEAIRHNQEGTVKLMLKIDEFGKVEEAEVLEADPAGVFDESVLGAFRQARFVPAQKDGRPVRSRIYIRVRFELNGS